MIHKQVKQFTAEHSVVIDCAASGSLTRKQLWKGLMLKFINPQRFNDQIDHCQVQWLNDRQFIREQQFPTFIVEDKVTLHLEHSIEVKSLGSEVEDFSLVITIDSASENQLVVNYQYSRTSANDDGLDVDNYLAEAYKRADEAFIEQIKVLTSSEEL